MAERGNDWCILRTNGPSTMRLTASLQAAGIAAWTPTEHIRRRVPRAKTIEHRIAPLAPTYVFVRAVHVADLRRIERAQVSPHPQFSIFRYYGETVFVRHAALHPLRSIQQYSYRDALPASGRRPRKLRGAAYDRGDVVKITEGAFTGFEAFVEISDSLTTMVVINIFGRDTGIKVPTLQLRGASVSREAVAA